ncbi:MAG: hypothetical protein HKN73_18110 [Gemmatimonadetes bacterium]|nr:hypothetical protein [Gemmatimonadota bacterium]
MRLREPFRLGVSERAEGGRDWVVLAALVAVMVAGLVLAWSLAGASPSLADAASVEAATRLAESPLPAGPWRFEWDRSSRGPEVEQASQVDALRRVAAGLTVLFCLVALLLQIGLWRQRLRHRAGEGFVHWAVGSNRRQRLARAVGQAGPWLGVAGASAVMVAFGMPLAIEMSWPGSAEVAPPVATALVAAVAVLSLVLRWESTQGEGEEGQVAGIVSSPVAVAAVGFAVLSAVAILAGNVPASSSGDGGERLVSEVTLPVAAADERGALLERWASFSGGEFGLVSAGAVRGMGHSAGVQVECGRCYEGGLPMPLKVVRAEVHAVSADTFPLLRLSIVRGRDFAASDGSVAIVSSALAARHFEDGEAIGRRVRIGDSPWLEVVGVVSDRPEARDHFEYEVYVPVGFAAPSGVEIVTGGSPGTMGRARAAAPAQAVVGETMTMAEVFSGHRWFARLSRLVGLSTAFIVFWGVWVGGRNEAKRVVFELSLRRAVGASVRDLRGHLMASTLRSLVVVFLVGAWLSLFFGAGLNAAYGGIPSLDPRAWSIAGAVVGVAFVWSRMPVYRAAERLSPTEGLRLR